MRAYRKIDEPYELKIEGGRLVLLGVGALLTLVLVFLVGVLVGKGLWGGKSGGGAALLAASPASPPPEPGKPQYTFYKDLTRPDGEVAAVQPPAPQKQEDVAATPVSAPQPESAGPPATASAPSETVAAPPSVKGAPSPKPAASAEPARPPEPAKVSSPPKVAAQAKPADTIVKPKAEGPKAELPKAELPKAELPKAQTLKAQAPKGEGHLPTPSFTVQVGSFRDRASADDQAKKIMAQGISAQVVLVSVEGRTWYRVQVGRFDTRADAEAHYQKKLRAKGVQGFVTAR
jgi:cell division protein FtsN